MSPTDERKLNNVMFARGSIYTQAVAGHLVPFFFHLIWMVQFLALDVVLRPMTISTPVHVD